MATDKDQLDGDAGARIDQAGRQVSFTVLASVLAMALRYVAALITTRILGIALFGSYVQAQTVTQLLSMTATLGLVPGVVPFVARARLADDPAGLRAVVRATWAITLIASSLTAAALFFLAPWLAESAYRDPALEQILRWLAPLVAFSAIMLGSLAIAQGFKAMRVHALIEKVVTVVATLTGLLVTWWFELGLPGVLVATLLGPAAGLLCSVGFLRARVPGVLSAGSPAAPWPVGSLLRTCWPLLGSGLIAFALTSVNVVLLGVLDDPGEVGKYGAAVRMLPVVFVVHQSAAQLFYAHASERYAAGDIAGRVALAGVGVEELRGALVDHEHHGEHPHRGAVFSDLSRVVEHAEQHDVDACEGEGDQPRSEQRPACPQQGAHGPGRGRGPSAQDAWDARAQEPYAAQKPCRWAE